MRLPMSAYRQVVWSVCFSSGVCVGVHVNKANIGFLYRYN